MPQPVSAGLLLPVHEQHTSTPAFTVNALEFLSDLDFAPYKYIGEDSNSAIVAETEALDRDALRRRKRRQRDAVKTVEGWRTVYEGEATARAKALQVAAPPDVWMLTGTLGDMHVKQVGAVQIPLNKKLLSRFKEWLKCKYGIEWHISVWQLTVDTRRVHLHMLVVDPARALVEGKIEKRWGVGTIRLTHFKGPKPLDDAIHYVMPRKKREDKRRQFDYELLPPHFKIVNPNQLGDAGRVLQAPHYEKQWAQRAGIKRVDSRRNPRGRGRIVVTDEGLQYHLWRPPWSGAPLRVRLISRAPPTPRLL